jgi:hypothetical protein
MHCDRNERASLCLDVRLADDAAVVVIFFAKKRGKIYATRTDRIEALDDKIRPYLWCLERRAKPARELRDRFLRRFCRRSRPKPVHILQHALPLAEIDGAEVLLLAPFPKLLH